MSQPKTIRDWLARIGDEPVPIRITNVESGNTQSLADANPLTAYKAGHAELSQALLDAYGNYHIIPGADVVVTAKGLEDAAKEVEDGVTVHFDEVGHITHVTMDAEAITRAVLEAAGIIVPDEVRKYKGKPDYVAVVDGEPLCISSGDRIAIKRATTGKEE